MDLLDYGYSKYEGNIIFKKGQTMKRVKVPKSLNEKINLTLKDNVVIISNKGDKKKSAAADGARPAVCRAHYARFRKKAGADEDILKL